LSDRTETASTPGSGRGSGSSGSAGARRSQPLLFSDPAAIDSHRVRYFLAEKGIVHRLVDVPAQRPAGEELLQHNPLGTCPTLIDRDLALYDARVVIDYLDERYPHPPMMPVDPVSRARTRLALFRLENDWGSLVPQHGEPGKPQADLLVERLVSAADVFSSLPYFLGEAFSILDVMLAPLLWRIQRCGIVLPNAAAPVAAYAERLHARPAFQASLAAEDRLPLNGTDEPR